MIDLERRASATQATLDRYLGRPFDWNGSNCGKMLIWHLRRMGRRPLIGQGGTWTSATGLRRFLARHGGSGAACLDGWGLLRIPPAAAIVGDIIEMAGEPPFGAFGVALGNGRVLAWHESADGAVVVQPSEYVAAWRV